MEDDKIAQLQELAKKLKIRNASRLLQASRGKVPGATLEAGLQKPRWRRKYQNRCLLPATGPLANQPQKDRMKDYKLT